MERGRGNVHIHHQSRVAPISRWNNHARQTSAFKLGPKTQILYRGAATQGAVESRHCQPSLYRIGGGIDTKKGRETKGSSFAHHSSKINSPACPRVPPCQCS